MSETPRMRSSWPATPGSHKPSPDSARVRSPLPDLPTAAPAATVTNTPLIPVNLIDAPSQRMYTLAIYGVLLVLRLYDWWKLVEDDANSFGLFAKWTFIDIIFLFGVPLLRIPWLEWSESTSLLACSLHTIVNGMLMFRIPVSSLNFDQCAISNCCTDSIGRGLTFPRQNCFRPGDVDFREQRSACKYLTQLIPYHGKTDHQHLARRVRS